METLASICKAHLVDCKWLLAPSHRIAHQWIEGLVRDGQPVVNLRSTTVLSLALDLVGPQMLEQGFTLTTGVIGSMIIDAAWSKLPPDGYLAKLQKSSDLSSVVYDSLLSLRLAGSSADGIQEAHLETKVKWRDIVVLLRSYEEFLSTHKLVDRADLFRMAINRLKSDPAALGPTTLILIPEGHHSAGLERAFLDAIPRANQRAIEYPLRRNNPGADISLLARVGRSTPPQEPKKDGTVVFFRAVGEINEVREVFRRCLADGMRLDDVEVLHTDAETYVPLFYSVARRYFSEPERPEGIPLTFADGIPTIMSRPGRALVGWLNWVAEGFPQRLLVEMIGEGLLQFDDEGLSFNSLARLLRPIAIGKNAANYLPNLDEQIKAAQHSKPGDEETSEKESRERKLKDLKSLRKLVDRLLKLSRDLGKPLSVLKAAKQFLQSCARSTNELDNYARETLIEQLDERRIWLERLNAAPDLIKWLTALPSQVRVLGSGPRPGHLHVASVTSGGHSGRKQTFVVGMDDRRFPGAALQDPILLDRERRNLNSELPTSATRLRQKIDDLATKLSRLSGYVTLSWPCQDLTDDRETFPGSFTLSAFRLVSGNHDADLETLNRTVGPPVSFAPTSDSKALDETERWLWRLSDETITRTDQTDLISAFYPHLGRGMAAQQNRTSVFGPYNGHVPECGNDLDPFAADGPVLSASALEIAGRCPLAFFFQRGLGLYLPEEMEVDEDRWLDPRQFGSLLHEVFREFMAELTTAGKRPKFDRDHQRLAEILQNVVQEWRKDVPPPNEATYRMRFWQLIRTSKVFLEAEEEFCRKSQPRYFEVSLGMERIGSGSPLDNEEPVSIVLAKGKSIRAKGRIDRVDETAKSRFAVWDYKLGSAYGYDANDPFIQGRRTQSLLYLKMIEAVIRKQLTPKGVVERFGYFFPTTRALGLRYDWDANTLATGMAILERLCLMIADGAFLATNDANDCKFCDYQPVCRDVDDVTWTSKSFLNGPGFPELQHLRNLRNG
jgi:ATP-dependent helicase/nuclease subunit B